ncbi:MAG: hypothetical protein ACYCVY_11665 [Acidiferrobacteraceae bacterium]
MTPVLEFLRDQAGEEEGLGHAGIETYKDAPYASVARECGQNSSDARSATPVTIRFDLVEIDRADYPALATQQAAVRACLEKARQNRDEKGTDFFTRAQQVLEADTIKILRIADSNTTGLTGPPVPGTPFHSLVKAAGVSHKDSDTAGGSFGIGKNAAFAASELQTVFYSTVYRESGREVFLAQGKTILVSHADASGVRWRATGYWGLPGFTPVTDRDDVPGWLRRDEVGTSVFAIGFRESRDWQYQIAASLLGNFFCAIYRGDMEFILDEGRLEISRSTIKMLFQDPRVSRAAEDSDQIEEFRFSRYLFECLTSSAAVAKELSVEGMGRVSVRILVREELPSRVCIIRNGMVITDNLASFGEKFTRFPMYKEFVALVEPLDHDGITLIKRLENPRHNGVSAERLPDPAKRKMATGIMKKLAGAVRKAIAEQALPKPADEVALDELSEFFDDLEQTDQPQEPGLDEDPETFTYTPDVSRKRKRPMGVTGKKGDAGGAGGADGDARGGDGGQGAGTGRGSGGTGTRRAGKRLDLDDFRNVLASTGPGWHRKLFFTPQETGRAAVSVLAAGLQAADVLPVVRADQGRTANGVLMIDLVAGERTAVNVAFSESYDGPVELVAVTVPERGGASED